MRNSNALQLFDQMRRRRGVGEAPMSGSEFAPYNRALGDKRDTFGSRPDDYIPERHQTAVAHELGNSPQMAEQGDGGTPAWQQALSAGLQGSRGVAPQNITPGGAVAGAAGKIGMQFAKSALLKKYGAKAGVKLLLGFL